MNKTHARARKPSMVTCSICHQPCLKCGPKGAHLHQGQWIGDECCWVEALRASE